MLLKMHTLYTLSMIFGLATAEESRTDRNVSFLRSSWDGLISRGLLPHPSKGHASSYQGCLSYSSYELSTKWTFAGQAPDCSWIHTGNGNGGSSGNSNGGGGGGSGTGAGNQGSGSSGNGGSSAGNNDGSNGNGNNSESNGNGADDSQTGDDDSNGGDGGGSNNGNQQDDEVVVSNEDVSEGDSTYDPVTDFDIAVCGTYENLWLWDLSLSCNASNIHASVEGCNCTFAAELMENGYLSCDDASSCPRNCAICTTCMSLLGCPTHPEIPLVSELVSSKFLLYLIAAAVALVVIMLAAYYSRRRQRIHGELKTSLIEEQKTWKIGKSADSGNCMYINSEMHWKPQDPDDCTPKTIEQVNTMSTSSASRFLEENSIPFGGESLLGERKNSESNEDELSASFGFPSYPIPQTTSGVQVVDTAAKGGEDIVSPISSPGGSLADTGTNDNYEDQHSDLLEDPEEATETNNDKENLELL